MCISTAGARNTGLNSKGIYDSPCQVGNYSKVETLLSTQSTTMALMGCFQSPIASGVYEPYPDWELSFWRQSFKVITAAAYGATIFCGSQVWRNDMKPRLLWKQNKPPHYIQKGTYRYYTRGGAMHQFAVKSLPDADGILRRCFQPEIEAIILKDIQAAANSE